MIKAPGILSSDSDTYEGLKQHVVALKQKQQESKEESNLCKHVLVHVIVLVLVELEGLQRTIQTLENLRVR